MGRTFFLIKFLAIDVINEHIFVLSFKNIIPSLFK